MSTTADVICLLDDEPSVLKALGRLLASEGWASEKFTEPVRFLAYAQSHDVALAVLDIRMPGMNGLTVQSALRSISPQTAVIVITAEDNPSDRTTAMAAGASAFFLKPLDDVRFIAAVHDSLGRTGKSI